jgi:hypothetical protein
MGPEQKRRNPMIRTIRLFVLIAVAISLPSLLSAKGKPTPPEEQTRQHCIITGDIESPGEVVVNLDASNTDRLVDVGDNPVCLDLASPLLSGLGQGNIYFADIMKDVACGYGQASIFTGPAGRNRGIFDFSFCPSVDGCKTPIYTNVDNGGTSQYLPHWIDDEYCPYRLRILNGIYDKKNATVTFDLDARVELWDGTLGESEYNSAVCVGYCSDLPVEERKPCLHECKADPGLPECDCNCINDYRVPTGSVNYIQIQLCPDSGCQ